MSAHLAQALQQLGFSAHDAEIYLALLKTGESPVGAIIKETGLHREIVYSALNRLEQQGLVQALEKRKIRHFLAMEPGELVRKIQEKAELAVAILPELQRRFREVPVSVKIYEGQEGFEEVQQDIQRSLDDGEEFYIIGAAGVPWYDMTKPFYKKYHRQCVKRGIVANMLTFRSEVEGILQNEVPGFCRVRALPQELAMPSETKIYKDKIIIEVFGEDPLAIMIRSRTVSAAYLQYFKALWATAEEVGVVPVKGRRKG